MSLKKPDIFQFADSRSYVSEFVAMNRDNESFSLRSTARELRWPISFLNDLVKGRKRLTLERALEFAKYLKLTELETTRLTYLTLLNSKKKLTRDFFTRLVGTETDVERFESPKFSYELNQMHYALVFELVKWGRGRYTSEELLSVAPTLKQIDLREFNEWLEVLAKHNIVEIKSGKPKALIERIILDESTEPAGIEINKAYAENFCRYADNFQKPSCFNSGFVEIRRSEFMDVAFEVVAFRNWLLKKGTQTNREEKAKNNETYIFQFDLNLVPMLLTQKLKNQNIEEQ